MAVPTGTVQTFTQTRIREDLANTINLLNAYETPFYSAIGDDTAKNRTPEWLAHTAPAPDTANFRVEGDDAVNISAAQPIRYKNVVQLMDKPVQVSSTSAAVDAAGMKELARQLLLQGVALKTDIETFMTGNYASVLGAAAVAGRLAGAEAWIATNFDAGVGYVAGGFSGGIVAAATDGTQRAFTEAILKSVIRQTWVAGGNNLNVVVGPTNKQTASGFTGRSTQYQNVTGNEKAVILGAADVYVSDFGFHRIYPDRFSRNRTALVVDFSTWEKSWLQPIQEKDLAVNGHSLRKLMWCEVTLKCMNEKANGKAADLT